MASEKDEQLVETVRFIMDFDSDLKDAVQEVALKLKMAGDKDASGKSVIHGVLRAHLTSWTNKRLDELLAAPGRGRDRFARQNLPRWETALRTVFAEAIPSSARWEDPEDIVTVLTKISDKTGIANMFMPTGGGLDLLGAAAAREEGCIEIGDLRAPAIFKPARLSFEAVSSDLGLAYFRLQGVPLAPAKVSSKTAKFVDGMQDLTEIGAGVYETRAVWENADEGELPPGARPVMRFLRGSVVIFAKASLYGQIRSPRFDAYSAIHEGKTEEEFRELVAELATAMRRHAEKLMEE